MDRDKRNLVRTLVARNPTPAQRRLLAAKRNNDEALAEALKSLLRRTGHRMHTPTPPRPPVAANLEVVARTLGLSEAETAVLLFVVTCARQDMQKLLDPTQLPRLCPVRSVENDEPRTPR